MTILNFQEIPIPTEYAADHRSRGGRNLRAYVAPAPRFGWYRCLLAEEPTGDVVGLSRKYERHLSVSFSDMEGIHCHPTMRLSDRESKQVAEHFFGSHENWYEYQSEGLVRHFYSPISG